VLFQLGDFTLHSGEVSDFKIDCDYLDDADIETLASILARRLPPFHRVEGVPRGGLRLAEALQTHTTPAPVYEPSDRPDLLIVDDVLTSGKSMDAQRAGRDALGAVLFARGPCPAWVMPLFQMFWT
jgi:orotate phosphoribosyltransferase